MKSQKSYEQQDGKLYIVPTPIGNLEDMTFRAIRILQEVDVIAAEDTRNTKKLCHHFDIHTPLMSTHEHNEMASREGIIQRLEKGESVAIVSDAGMPCISDPGVHVVERAIEEGYAVVPLPGANAAVTALVASGISPQPFTFYGFLPRKKKERLAVLENYATHRETLIFYESPHRLKEMLRAIEETCGSERSIVLAREVTKKFEEFLRGTVREAVAWAEESVIRGEFCVILSPFTGEVEREEESTWWETLSLVEHVDYYIEETQIRTKEAVQKVADDRNLKKRDVYNAYHADERQ